MKIISQTRLIELISNKIDSHSNDIQFKIEELWRDTNDSNELNKRLMNILLWI